jgi:protein phosphatase
MFFGHIGDSRIYYLPARESCLRQITQDDTHVGWLVRKGKLNEREARSHPQRNMLQQALGAGNQFVNPQLGTVVCEPGDRFLLCTDGVVDGFRDELLLDQLRSIESADAGKNAAHLLVEAAVAASGRDNTTAQLIDVL